MRPSTNILQEKMSDASNDFGWLTEASSQMLGSVNLLSLRLERLSSTLFLEKTSLRLMKNEGMGTALNYMVSFVAAKKSFREEGIALI